MNTQVTRRTLVRAALATPVLAASTSTLAPAALAADVQVLERAHAHNDYLHLRPLLGALDRGFCSIEADVWLVDGRLYLGHAAPNRLKPFVETYLAPLAKRVAGNGGSVYPGWDGSLRLLVDIKSEGGPTWKALERDLAGFPELLTSYDGGVVAPRAVTVVASGNRPFDLMAAASSRRSFVDGRLGDLDRGVPTSLMPLISADWYRTFGWLGYTPMPADKRARLRDIADRAHAQGHQLRFWNTNDLAGGRERVWAEEVAAGVDSLNTDDLPGLQRWLLANDPQER